ncbi:MAG: PilZ domain-containing protein [Myxococcota bacterium]
MNTSVGYHQAPRPPRVPLDEVLIKLYPEGFVEQEFEADGINVGPGGLSMRANVLPEVGSTLRCQLESPHSPEPIEMIGQVVWAHDSGPQFGEFGIRFTRLSDEDQTRIEALIQRWGRTTAVAPTVRLQLDGVGSSFVAELQEETESTLRVEQTLPFLAIGTGVENDSSGRRGHLDTVELKFDEEVPKLVLSIEYETEAGQGFVDPVGEPNLPEPQAQQAADGTGSPDAVQAPDAAHSAGVAAVAELDRDTLPDDVDRASRPNRRTSTPRLHDTPRIVRYDAQEELVFDKSTSDRIREYAKNASDQMSSSVGSVKNALTQRALPSIARTTRRGATVAARFVEALRGRLEEKPRRKQVPRSEAARAHLKNSRRSGRRYVMFATVAAACGLCAWGIYLWAVSPSPVEPDLDAGLVDATADGAAPDTSSVASPGGSSAYAATNGPNGSTATRSTAGSSAATGADNVSAARSADGGSANSARTAGSTASGSTQAAAQGGPLPPERVRGQSFGLDQVPKGEKYVLRMSNPVKEMDGLVEDDGFSVMIPGSLSLSRAGPIATAHPDVEHAAIHNRGDFSELTIRFVNGRHPAYRVEARGPAIEITIAR